MIQVTLPDGSSRSFNTEVTALDVAADIGPGLAKAARGARINGQMADLMTPLSDGDALAILTEKDADWIELARHSLAHIMAEAVTELMQSEGRDAADVKMGVGPVIDSGFYYDFDLPRSLVPEDLARIDTIMREIIAAKMPFARIDMTREAALTVYQDKNDPYKLELIDDLAADEAITFYRQGDEQRGFTDLCRGPHVANTGVIPKFFKLTSIAGAYWRGDEDKPQLQRVYGVAFAKKEELKHYEWQVEEAKKRDHRKLGKELDIFTLDEDVGPGLPLWLPNGAILIEEVEKLAKDLEFDAGYERVRSPHLTKENLFLTSGHLPYYEEDMFPPMEIDGIRYFLKPMNCPFHHKIFDARPRSYRDMPIRYAEYGTCYRYEDSGALMGLMRVRSMQMNDAHIYCTEAQFEAEFMGVIEMYLEIFRIFGINEYTMRLSKHSKEGLGKKYVDNEPLWQKTEAMVRDVMTRGAVNFVEEEDEAAFYGPKIDVQIKSAIGREFTLSTNQVDFAIPERFGLQYVDENNERQTPLCIHRAPLSTHERFVGFLIEHFAGDFPLWLAPEQVRLVTISDAHHEYADDLARNLKANRIRCSVDKSNERMNYKIRQAELRKVPYIVIVGDKEMEQGSVSFRSRKEDAQNGVESSAFCDHIQRAIASRALNIVPLTG